MLKSVHHPGSPEEDGRSRGKSLGLQASFAHKKENKGNTSIFLKDETRMDRHRWMEGRTEARRTDPTIRPIRRICRGTSGGFAGVHQGYIRVHSEELQGHIRVHSEDFQGYIRVHSGTFGYIRTCRSPRKHKGFAMSWGTFGATAHPFYNIKREKACECMCAGPQPPPWCRVLPPHPALPVMYNIAGLCLLEFY